MRLLFLSFFTYCSMLLYSQTGYNVIYNYNTNEFVKATTNAFQQGEDGKLYLATSKGLVIYNGVSKYLLPFNEPLLNIVSGKNLIFNTKNTVGYITENGNNDFSVHFIKTDSTQTILDIALQNENMFILTDSTIIITNAETGSVLYKIKAAFKSSSLFTIQDQTFLQATDKGIFSINNDSISKITLPDSIAITSKLHAKINEKEILLIANSKLYTFDGTTIKPFKSNANLFLKNNTATTIAASPNNIISIGTKNNGIVLIDSNEGTILNRINQSTGLNNNDIKALFTDSRGDLWISHTYGISKAILSVPVSDFTKYPGLEGDVRTVYVKDTIVYVGTTSGVFILKQTHSSGNTMQTSTSNQNIENSTQKKQVERVVKVTFTSEDGGTPVVKEIPVMIDVNQNTEKTTNEIQSVNTTQSIQQLLQGTFPYFYKKIEDIEGNCIQLLEVNNDIYVARSKGLYVINQSKAKRFSSIEGFVQMLVSGNTLFALTYSKVTAFDTHTHKFISQASVFPETNSIAISDSIIWVGGIGKAGKISVSNTGILKTQKIYTYNNGIPETIFVSSVKSTLFFAGEDILEYNAKTDQLEKQGTLEVSCNVNSAILSKQAGFVWTEGCSGWSNLGVFAPEKQTTKQMKLFSNLTDIFVDTDSSLWLVSEGSLYKLKNKTTVTSEDFTLEVAQFKDKEGSLYNGNKFTLPMNSKAISFDLAAQFYINEQSTLYRYKLEGLSDTWSDWSTNTNYSIPYIPGGTYTLEAEAKNIFGQKATITPIVFSIPEDYEKSWWFYMIIMIVLFSVLLGLYIFHLKRWKDERILFVEQIHELEEKMS